MPREEAIENLWKLRSEFQMDTTSYEDEAIYIAIQSLEAWDKVIKFVSDRIEYWDAPCSGDEVVRKELASVMWEIRKQMKEV